MRNAVSKLFMLVLSAGLLYGCAFSNDYVKIDFTPTNVNTPVTTNTTLQLEKLKDARGVDPKLISYKGVQAKMGGQYINDIEISELLTNSIKDLLIKMGYKLDSPQYDLILTGEVLKFDSYVIMGFWSGEIEATIQVNLKLINNKNKTIIWNETISGYGKTGGVQIDHWGNRKEAFDLALDNLMRNIASSVTFRNAMASN